MKHTWIYKKIGDITNKCHNIHWQEIDPQLSFNYVDLSSVNRETHLIENTEKISVQTAPSRAKQIVRENDIVFGTTRPLLKRVCCIPKEYDMQICSTGFCVLRPKEYVLPHWIYYHLCTNDFYEYIAPLQTGANYPSVSDGDIRKYSIPLPPISEQESIVRYLDDKTAKIDETVNLLEQQKTDLQQYRKALISQTVTHGLNPNAKLKDSGVDWIGQIPEGWEITRGKNMMSQITLKSDSSVKVALENIESERGKFIATESTFDGNGIAFRKGDILYGKLRPYLKKVWLAEFDGNAVGDFFVYRNEANSIPAFIKYLLLSDSFTKIANESTNGAKMPRVSSDFVLKLQFPLPPLSEQESIARYLDDKTAKIDEAIKRIDEQIADLRAYRTALISDVVTGKIDVRN